LIEPAQGRILVDGKPLERGMLGDWRARIGYVPQDTFLLHDSVRANLRWARPDATEAQLWRALELAAADTFVRNLPEGLDTVVGDRGVLVSGGERQRLSLARALVRSPKILILDEATSALDSENEDRIRQAIDRLHHQMTIVVITHRLATTRAADVIHVLEDGRLVESGTWQALMGRSSSRFRILCETQEVHAPVLH
jgi:ATP-binding cassette subfamily C protein